MRASLDAHGMGLAAYVAPEDRAVSRTFPPPLPLAPASPAALPSPSACLPNPWPAAQALNKYFADLVPVYLEDYAGSLRPQDIFLVSVRRPTSVAPRPDSTAHREPPAPRRRLPQEIAVWGGV